MKILFVSISVIWLTVGFAHAQTNSEDAFTYKTQPLPAKIMQINYQDLNAFGDYFDHIPAKVDSVSRLYRSDNVLISLFEEKVTVNVLRKSLDQVKKNIIYTLNKRPTVTLYGSKIIVINNVRYLIVSYKDESDEFLIYKSDLNKSFVRVGGQVEFKENDRSKAELLLREFLSNGKFTE